jgi:hypothetical protein
MMMALLLLGVPSRRRQSHSARGRGLVILVFLVGCGGGGSGGNGGKTGGTPAGSYTITVKATSSSPQLSHTLNVALAVQ